MASPPPFPSPKPSFRSRVGSLVRRSSTGLDLETYHKSRPGILPSGSGTEGSTLKVFSPLRPRITPHAAANPVSEPPAHGKEASRPLPIVAPSVFGLTPDSRPQERPAPVYINPSEPSAPLLPEPKLQVVKSPHDLTNSPQSHKSALPVVRASGKSLDHIEPQLAISKTPDMTSREAREKSNSGALRRTTMASPSLFPSPKPILRSRMGAFVQRSSTVLGIGTYHKSESRSFLPVSRTEGSNLKFGTTLQPQIMPRMVADRDYPVPVIPSELPAPLLPEPESQVIEFPHDLTNSPQSHEFTLPVVGQISGKISDYTESRPTAAKTLDLTSREVREEPDSAALRGTTMAGLSPSRLPKPFFRSHMASLVRRSSVGLDLGIHYESEPNTLPSDSSTREGILKIGTSLQPQTTPRTVFSPVEPDIEVIRKDYGTPAAHAEEPQPEPKPLSIPTLLPVPVVVRVPEQRVPLTQVVSNVRELPLRGRTVVAVPSEDHSPWARSITRNDNLSSQLHTPPDHPRSLPRQISDKLSKMPLAPSYTRNSKVDPQPKQAAQVTDHETDGDTRSIQSARFITNNPSVDPPPEAKPVPCFYLTKELSEQGQAEPSTSNIRIATPLPSAHEGFSTHPEQQYGLPSVTNLEHAAPLPHMSGGQQIPTNVEGVSEVVEPEQELAIPTMFDSSDVNYLLEQLQFDVEIARDADNPSQSLLSCNNVCIRDDGPPLMVHPALDSSNLVNPDAPACKRLIRRAFSPQEVTSLIEAIFLSEDEAKIVRDLREDDAQTFIDVIHEALNLPDLQPQLRRTCIGVLCRICGRQALLPRSLQIPLCYNRSDVPLYHGGFADVWKGEYQGRHVAIKALRVYSTSDFVKITRRFCKEVVTWGTLRHPNVLSLLGITMGDGQFAMISDWMTNGNINEFIKARKDVNRFELLKDVARGLIYMHDQEMIHGDLKGANILIDEHYHARLADFGLLTIISDPAIFTTPSSIVTCGTMRWMSPELLYPSQFGLEDSRPTKQSDCYALGMVTYEVLSGKAPFAASTDFVVMRKVIEGEHPEVPEGVQGLWFTDDLWGILKRCWATRSESRPSIEAVFECLEQISKGWKPPPEQIDEEQEKDEDDWDLTGVLLSV